jgi:hypothetical protein
MRTSERPAGSDSLWLAIGSVDHLNGGRQVGDLDDLLIVELPPDGRPEPPNTQFVSFSSPREIAYTTLSKASALGGTLPMERLFAGLKASPFIATILGERPPSTGVNSLIPLFLARRVRGELHLYSQIRFAGDDALFIRTTAQPLAVPPDAPPGPPAAAFWAEAMALHAKNFLFLNNHQRYYKKCLAGKEVEVKFTLAASTDVWGLTADMAEVIARGGWDGFRFEYRDEFQQWDYMNQLFEVSAPKEERGYISFILATDGRYIVKRKRFTRDSMVREESLSAPLEIRSSLEDYVATHVQGVSRRLPAFRRVRYDVNFESLASGHVYGVFFDRVTVPEAPGVVLCQCEVEYLRSRAVLDPAEDVIWREFPRVLDFVRDFLSERGIPFDEGYYSKLSFLRDHFGGGAGAADGTPGLAP